MSNEPHSSSASDSEDADTENCLELIKADPDLLEVIAKDTTNYVKVNDVKKQIRFYGDTAVVFGRWGEPREIQYQNATRQVLVDLMRVKCSVGKFTEFDYGGETHRIKLGAPTRELYIDDNWIQCDFGSDQAITTNLGIMKVDIKLEGPEPTMIIGKEKRFDLVLGKINLTISPTASVFPIFLDAKPQKFEIDGKPITLEI